MAWLKTMAIQRIQSYKSYSLGDTYCEDPVLRLVVCVVRLRTPTALLKIILVSVTPQNGGEDLRYVTIRISSVTLRRRPAILIVFQNRVLVSDTTLW